MPPLGTEDSLEVTRIASACGLQRAAGLARRPFRAPHHTISAAGLIGGGTPPRPGEVTLAHRGVLFLDELAEFSRAALEALRQPLEDGSVTLVRAGHAITLPCRFMLVAAVNPCPCGRGPESESCRCGPADIRRYDAKLSGALADRIDIAIALSQPAAAAMAGEAGETSAPVRKRVIAARELQTERLGQGRCNAEMTVAETRRYCRPEPAARKLLARTHERLGLSGRGHERVLRLGRTLADLDGTARIREPHIAAALGLRNRRAK
jgi:magnesium chelatase family protein